MRAQNHRVSVAMRAISPPTLMNRPSRGEIITESGKGINRDIKALSKDRSVTSHIQASHRPLSDQQMLDGGPLSQGGNPINMTKDQQLKLAKLNHQITHQRNTRTPIIIDSSFKD